MLLVLRWRKRRREEKARTSKQENGLRVQGIDANGTGSSLQDKSGSGKRRNFSLCRPPIPTKLSQDGTSKRYFLCIGPCR